MWIQVLTGVQISILLESAAPAPTLSNMIYFPRKRFINLAFSKERNDHSPRPTALSVEQIQHHCLVVSFAWAIELQKENLVVPESLCKCCSSARASRA